MGTNRFLSVLWDYVIVSFGTLLYCLGWTSFLIPGGIASGGGTGLCTIVYFATGIPVAYSFFVLIEEDKFNSQFDLFKYEVIFSLNNRNGGGIRSILPHRAGARQVITEIRSKRRSLIYV